MRFLADESCDFKVVRALREAGFDVLPVVEVSPRATDDRDIELAVLEDRILLTEDKDFGQLVYASAVKGILRRTPTGPRPDWTTPSQSYMSSAILAVLAFYLRP